MRLNIRIQFTRRSEQTNDNSASHYIRYRLARIIILLTLCVMMLTVIVPTSPVLDQLLDILFHALILVLRYYFNPTVSH